MVCNKVFCLTAFDRSASSRRGFVRPTPLNFPLRSYIIFCTCYHPCLPAGRHRFVQLLNKANGKLGGLWTYWCQPDELPTHALYSLLLPMFIIKDDVKFLWVNSFCTLFSASCIADLLSFSYAFNPGPWEYCNNFTAFAMASTWSQLIKCWGAGGATANFFYTIYRNRLIIP
jgi:hypothetical protein